VHLAQQALLSTVDQVLRERGANPASVSDEDKLALATQLVQLAVLREHEIRTASAELAIALGSSSDLQITKLAEAARAAIERKRSRT
jgi:hypothetical protein